MVNFMVVYGQRWSALWWFMARDIVPSPENSTPGAPGRAFPVPQGIRRMDLVPGEVAEEEHQEPGAPQQAAMGKRFGPWWTVLSFGIALAVLVFGISKAGITWNTTART